MFAMYMNSVSIWYGSPAQALVMTMCIMPCAASGASQVNALSMRIGVPSSSSSRSCGPLRKTQRHAGQHGVRLAALARPGRQPAGSASDRRLVAPGPRAYRSRQAASAADASRGRSGTRWSGPRCRAWRASRPGGRPSFRAGGRTYRSRADRSSIAWLNATSASSVAMRRIVAAGMPQRSGDRIGCVSAVQVAFGEKLENRRARGVRRAG